MTTKGGPPPIAVPRSPVKSGTRILPPNRPRENSVGLVETELVPRPASSCAGRPVSGLPRSERSGESPMPVREFSRALLAWFARARGAGLRGACCEHRRRRVGCSGQAERAQREARQTLTLLSRRRRCVQSKKQESRWAHASGLSRVLLATRSEAQFNLECESCRLTARSEAQFNLEPESCRLTARSEAQFNPERRSCHVATPTQLGSARSWRRSVGTGR